MERAKFDIPFGMGCDERAKRAISPQCTAAVR
jgi:hypothetical protein